MILIARPRQPIARCDKVRRDSGMRNANGIHRPIAVPRPTIARGIPTWDRSARW
jgi:hypothetical protein